MAKLSYEKRKKMPKKEFALPSKREGGKGGFPINDKNHARAALQAADGARSGKPLPPKEKAEVRRKVHAKFPDIGKKPGSNQHTSEHEREKRKMRRSVHVDSL